MTEVETLRKQLEDAGNQIIALSKENSDLKASNALQADSISNGARHSLKLELVAAFEKLFKDASQIENSHEHAKTVGFNDAVEKCISLVKPS